MPDAATVRTCAPWLVYPVRAAGCDLSAGMLRAVPHPALFCADVAAPPVGDGAFDVVLAAVIRDASVVADYVASWAGFYQDQVARPWADVVAGVRREVQAVIDHEGTFTVSGDLAAFVCR